MRSNTMFFYLRLLKLFYVILVLCNLLLPIHKQIMKFDFFQLVSVIIWTYGLLCSLGYFKTMVSKSPDGVVRYDTNVPILQVGITRIIQTGFYLIWMRGKIWWLMLTICFVLDVICIVLQLLDKSSYYYESIEEFEDEVNIN